MTTTRRRKASTLPLQTRRRKASTLPLQTAQLALAVPQVVGHRLTRLAMAGPVWNARDRREFQGMSHEKVLAFYQSWFAMGWAVVQSMQKAWLAMLQGARVPLLDMNAVLGKGLAPIQRRATGNARRLARTPLR